ncbi:transposon TX1 [Tanacetum coccineum]
MGRRDKCVISSPGSTGSTGVRLRKKRKAGGEGMFDCDEEEMTFNQGKTIVEKGKDKKKIGRRSITKAMEVERKTGIKGLGENKKRVSDEYKVYHEVSSKNKGIFHFGSGKEDDANRVRCNVNMEQVKKIGEMIGVSWVRAEEEAKDKNYNQEGNEVEGSAEKQPQGMWEKNWIRSIIKDKSLDVIRLQETKCRVVDDFWIEDIWGGKGYGYSQLPANRNSGGIMVIWDTRVFVCKEAVGDERFITVKGSWKGKDEDVFLICIYGPHVNTKEMMEFNEFINNTRLIEIPMGGRKFTRVSDDGMKFSKLDCFLLNEKFNEMWGNLSVVALDRKLLDHCSIVIKDVELDFGPKPFRVFNIWLEESDFSKVVEVAWKREVKSSRSDCIFRDRLKNVKASLRIWSKGMFSRHKKKMEKLRNDAME